MQTTKIKLTDSELKAYQLGMLEGSKRKGSNRKAIQYNTNSLVKHQLNSVSLIEAASLLIDGTTPAKISINVGPNGEELDNTDEILVDNRFLALILLKGLSLNVKVESHLDQVTFTRDQEAQTIRVEFNK